MIRHVQTEKVSLAAWKTKTIAWKLYHSPVCQLLLEQHFNFSLEFLWPSQIQE